MAKDCNPEPTSLADRLRPLLHSQTPEVRLDDMVARLEGHEGLGPVLFVLTLPVMLPLPPGVSMVMALPVLVVAPQIALGKRKLWLPDWLARRTLKHESLAKLLDKILPALEKIEGVVKPRLSALTGRIGAALVGLACTLLGIILVLPIPFANLLPSWSLGALSLGLTRKDGVFIIAGYGLLVAALGVIALGCFGVDLGVGRIATMI
jgi:hypothetical protein